MSWLEQVLEIASGAMQATLDPVPHGRGLKYPPEPQPLTKNQWITLACYYAGVFIAVLLTFYFCVYRWLMKVRAGRMAHDDMLQRREMEAAERARMRDAQVARQAAADAEDALEGLRAQQRRAETRNARIAELERLVGDAPAAGGGAEHNAVVPPAAPDAGNRADSRISNISKGEHEDVEHQPRAGRRPLSPTLQKQHYRRELAQLRQEQEDEMMARRIQQREANLAHLRAMMADPRTREQMERYPIGNNNEMLQQLRQEERDRRMAEVVARQQETNHQDAAYEAAIAEQLRRNQEALANESSARPTDLDSGVDSLMPIDAGAISTDDPTTQEERRHQPTAEEMRRRRAAFFARATS